MATAKLRVVHSDDHDSTGRLGPQAPRPLNRIQKIREQQGVTLRTCSRRMKLDLRSLRAQETPEADLRISQLRQWQQVLDVPLIDLIEDSGLPLSRPVMERARLVRLMKTAMSIREQADSPAVKRFAQVLVEQLVEIMPELAEISPWHSVGQRRTLDEMGRIAERTIPTGAVLANLQALRGDD